MTFIFCLKQRLIYTLLLKRRSLSTGFGNTQSNSGFGNTQSNTGFGNSQSNTGFGNAQSNKGFGSSRTDTGFGNQNGKNNQGSIHSPVQGSNFQESYNS